MPPATAIAKAFDADTADLTDQQGTAAHPPRSGTPPEHDELTEDAPLPWDLLDVYHYLCFVVGIPVQSYFITKFKRLSQGASHAEASDRAFELVVVFVVCFTALLVAHYALKRTRSGLGYFAAACGSASFFGTAAASKTSLDDSWNSAGIIAGQVLISFAVVPYAAAVKRRHEPRRLRYLAFAVVPAACAYLLIIPALKLIITTMEGRHAIDQVLLAVVISVAGYPSVTGRPPRYSPKIRAVAWVNAIVAVMVLGIGFALYARGVTVAQAYESVSLVVSKIAGQWQRFGY